MYFAYNMSTLITLLIIGIFTTIHALEAKTKDEAAIDDVMQKYFNKIPDVESKYVIDEALSKTISGYFNGKLNAFPLFKISVKMDRQPVKIPWTLDLAQKNQNEKRLKKRYKYVKVKKTTNTTEK